jgi:hypothetical protein
MGPYARICIDDDERQRTYGRHARERGHPFSGMYQGKMDTRVRGHDGHGARGINP